MERGVFRGIVIGTMIWLIILLLWFCNCGSVENTNFDLIASRRMPEEEVLWLTEVENCLVNMGLAFHENVQDVIPQITNIAAEPFRCGGVDNAGGCANGIEELSCFKI